MTRAKFVGMFGLGLILAVGWIGLPGCGGSKPETGVVAPDEPVDDQASAASDAFAKAQKTGQN